jgi:hypothetical protein
MTNNINIQNKLFINNEIKTRNYTIWTFIPLNLIIQFSKAPNVYFLLITIMQTFRVISISNGNPMMAFPLSLVVIASMVKDAFEDYARYKSDE